MHFYHALFTTPVMRGGVYMESLFEIQLKQLTIKCDDKFIYVIYKENLIKLQKNTVIHVLTYIKNKLATPQS